MTNIPQFRTRQAMRLTIVVRRCAIFTSEDAPQVGNCRPEATGPESKLALLRALSDKRYALARGMTVRELPLAFPHARQLGDIGRSGLADRRRRARETWRRRGLGDAVAADKNLSGRHVRMSRRFA